MRTADIVSAIVLIALAALSAAGTLDLPYWSDTSPGPAFIARWMALVAAVIGAVLLWEAATRARSSPIEWPGRDGVRRVLMAGGLMWAFLLALPWLGFAIAALLFMLAMLMLVQRRPLGASLLATAITVGASYGLFVTWLQIKLPIGLLGI